MTSAATVRPWAGAGELGDLPRLQVLGEHLADLTGGEVPGGPVPFRRV